MPFKEFISQIKQAFKANLKPGAILWFLMLIFFLAYASNRTFSDALGEVSIFKKSIGYPFSFGVYILFAALMPEALKILFFQKRRVVIKNLYNIVFFGLVFGVLGVMTDIFTAIKLSGLAKQTILKHCLLKLLSIREYMDR